MSRRTLGWLLVLGAFVAIVVAAALLAPALVQVVLPLVGLAALATVALGRWPRWVRIAVAVVGGAGGALAATTVHETLRGERQDDGSTPLPGFHAPPLEKRPPGPLHVLVWGDCRGGITVQDLLCDAIRARKPHFTVGLGDLVGMARAYQFEILAKRLRATGVPFVTVPGNHDVDPFGSLRPYEEVFGPRNWAFADDAAGVLFVGLDTAHGVLDPKDVDAVERGVRERPAALRRVLLFVHHPLYPPLEHPEKPLPEDDATRRLRALVEAEGVQVFASHYHAYDEQTRGAVVQVTTGGAGARPESDDPYHYVWVTIDESGVHHEKVDLARIEDVSAARDRWLTFVDEAPYAAMASPNLAVLAFLGAALLLAGAAAACLPGRPGRDEGPGSPATPEPADTDGDG